MENEKNKRKFKIMIVSMITVLSLLFCGGIGQSIYLNAKKNSLNSLQQENANLENEYEEQKTKYDYMTSDDYNDDYNKNENDYGEDGDKKVEVTGN